MQEISPARLDIGKKDRPLFLILLLLPALLVIRTLNNDIWFLLNSGRYVFAHGIPYVEPFTLHQGFQFVMQQWLSACIFWLTYSAAGAAGLNLLAACCYAATLFVIYKLCMKVSGGYFLVSFAAAMFAAIFLRLIMVQRPYIFSTLILAVELYLLECFIDGNKPKYLIFLPVLSALLINMQAAIWPMLFVLFLPYAIDAFQFKAGIFAGQGYEKKALFIAAGLMLIAGFANPCGLEAMTYLFRSYGHEEINLLVNEMKPPNINTVLGIVTFACLAAVFLAYTLHRKGTTRPRYVLLTAGTAFMALSSVRSLSFFLIGAIFPLAYFLKDIKFKIKTAEASKKSLLFRKALAAAMALVCVLLLADIGWAGEKLSSENAMLRDTIRQIESQGDTSGVRLYTGYNDGNMAEFYGIAAYMDTRAEVFLKGNNKKDDVMREYAMLQQGGLYYKDFLDKYRFTHLIVTKADTLYVNLMHDEEYRAAYSNERYTLFERKTP